MKSILIKKHVGNAHAIWEEKSPLKWRMEESLRGGSLIADGINCDITALSSGYDLNFLLAMKDILISSRHRKRLISIQAQHDAIKIILARVYSKGFSGVNTLRRIGPEFLLALDTLRSELPENHLSAFRNFYKNNRDDDRIFDKRLQLGDFPAPISDLKYNEDKIRRVLAKALRQSALVHILDVTEAAFEEKRTTLARYVFTRLALNIYCRPESYRRLTVADLRVDHDPETGAVNYFLAILPAKSGVHDPQKIIYRLHPEVGKLLVMQRESVVTQFGHILKERGIDLTNLALFPATRLRLGNLSWVSHYANDRAGMLPTGSLNRVYFDEIKLLTKTHLNANVLRHTIGTQLAQMGCSAHTIQAVLKHASDKACQVYVDIAFKGLIDKLSDGLKPGFDAHFSVVNSFVNSSFAIPPERRIESEDLEVGKMETTGMCGRHVACGYAPIACYACPRFIPCVDADHSINLDVVEREINTFEGRGQAMQHEVQRWKTIRNHIRVITAACENRRMASAVEAAAGSRP